MGMIEISERGRKGGLGKAIRNFKEMMEHLEGMGERDDDNYDEDYGREQDDDRMYRDRERMGERRGVRGTGRYSRYR